MALPPWVERRPVSEVPEPAGHLVASRTAGQEVPDDATHLGPGQLAAHEALEILFRRMVQLHEAGS